MILPLIPGSAWNIALSAKTYIFNDEALPCKWLVIGDNPVVGKQIQLERRVLLFSPIDVQVLRALRGEQRE